MLFFAKYACVFCCLPAAGAFCCRVRQRGFFTAERGGRRQFQLAVPCQPGRFDPILLSCAKKNGVDRQEEVAQRKPLRRVFSGLFPKQRDRGPSGTLGLPDTGRLPVGRWFVLLSGCWSEVRQTCETRLGAKHFCRAKMPCGGRDCHVCCSAG